jgi:hypothetical protein
MALSISATQLLETAGYAVIAGILPDNQVQRLSRLITSLADATHGTRKLLDAPWCSELADNSA